MISGLILNAFGNGLCISANMGSGLWTASAVNLNKWLGWNTGLLLFIIGVINAITNQFLIKRFDGKRLVGEVLYVLFFSYFVNIFTDLLNMVGVPSLPIVIRAILSCLGVAFFCVAISLYQRANIVMHPNDDTTNILRFFIFKRKFYGCPNHRFYSTYYNYYCGRTSSSQCLFSQCWNNLLLYFQWYFNSISWQIYLA